MKASLQRLKSARRPGSMPSISAITVTGSGTARSRTTSKGSPRRSGARLSSTSARMRGSSATMRRGVKPRFTTARRVSWTGGSSEIRLRAFVNANGFVRTASAKRTRKRTMFHDGGGRPSFPPFISTVNMARDEKSSGRFSTDSTSSYREMQ